MASEFMLKLLIGVIAFGVLFVFWLMVGTDLYEAIFPPDTTTDELADRIEYMACGGGFGIQKDCSQAVYNRNVIPVRQLSDNEEYYVLFTQQAQTYEIIVEEIVDTQGHRLTSNSDDFQAREVPRTLTNPCNGACVCKSTAPIPADACTALDLPAGIEVRRVAEITEEGREYAPPVIRAEDFNPEMQLPIVFLEYLPQEGPLLVFSAYTQQLFSEAESST